MLIDILTLFPKMFDGPFKESILKRAQEKSLIEIKIHDLRKWTTDNHKTVDDRPFGGGVGMVIKVDVVDRAVSSLLSTYNSLLTTKVILLDAGGKTFTQKKAIELSKVDHLILIAGHYEGVDYRVHKYIADEIISIGDYVLTGGEIPAMVLTDSIARQISGVIVKPDAIKHESFSKSSHFSQPSSHPQLLEHPHFTRPDVYKNWKVPKILLQGNHKEIENWRNEESLKKTKKVRPDLLNS